MSSFYSSKFTCWHAKDAYEFVKNTLPSCRLQEQVCKFGRTGMLNIIVYQRGMVNSFHAPRCLDLTNIDPLMAVLTTCSQCMHCFSTLSSLLRHFKYSKCCTETAVFDDLQKFIKMRRSVVNQRYYRRSAIWQVVAI